MRRVRAYVGLGANLGDASATVAAGINALAVLPATRLAGVSRLYATRPVGVEDQPEFRNAVVALDVPAGLIPGPGRPRCSWRSRRRSVPSDAGSASAGDRAELDLDLLVFGRAQLSVDRPPAGLSLDPGKAAAS